jgi:hypothetical protein
MTPSLRFALSAFAFISSLTSGIGVAAENADLEYGRLLFSDDFSSNAFGPRWGHYKSGSIVKDGVLIGITPENSDHSAVDNIRFEGERNLEVSVKFRFVSDKAKSFNLWFDDKDYKGSHAGHICSVSVSPTMVTVSDAKTGSFQNDIYEKKKSPEGLSAEQKAFLESKTKRVPTTVSLEEWHAFTARTKGDEVEVHLDGKVVVSFKSEGIGHPTKSLVSLTTNQVDVHYDDFSVKASGPAPSKP